MHPYFILLCYVLLIDKNILVPLLTHDVCGMNQSGQSLQMLMIITNLENYTQHYIKNSNMTKL